MNDEAARQSRPARSPHSAPPIVTAAWTSADAAELDVLVDELCRSYFQHRDRCDACQPCPAAEAYIEHRAHCWKCQNAIKVSTPTFGAPCTEYVAHAEHIETCPACAGPCPGLREAIDVVLDWRQARLLKSRAVALRAEQDALEAAA